MGLSPQPTATDQPEPGCVSGRVLQLHLDRTAPAHTPPAKLAREMSLTRRTFAASSLAAATTAAAAPRPEGVLVDTHIHLFAMDTVRFPYAPMGTYRPPPQGLSDYTAFVHASGIDHAIVVHPEPYQDDHTYLEYCLNNEPKPGFFKGTCLYDSARSDTPDRLNRLIGRYPDRIVAFRIHAMGERGSVPSETGLIRNRDLTADYMRRTWRAVADAGIAIQMHFLPFYAPLSGLSPRKRRPNRLPRLWRNAVKPF
jgi:hypothetical protein